MSGDHYVSYSGHQLHWKELSSFSKALKHSLSSLDDSPIPRKLETQKIKIGYSQQAWRVSNVLAALCKQIAAAVDAGVNNATNILKPACSYSAIWHRDRTKCSRNEMEWLTQWFENYLIAMNIVYESASALSWRMSARHLWHTCWRRRWFWSN